MTYNFLTLSHADFEDLVRDLIGRELGIRFEAFGAGPDGGMDGRHALGLESTVLQAKHYAGSRFSALESTMKRERPSIDRLSSSRYILATSRPLSPGNKRDLARCIGPALKTESDVFGSRDLNALLRKFPEVERTHIKLWLSSTTVLEKVVRAAAHAYTAISKDEIVAKVRVYASNASFGDSLEKLETNHVLIVSGPPGVGKTTLAEMLCYAYIGEGWEFVAIRSLDDGFAALVDTRKQIFFFDDFLGKIALDLAALTAKDSDLARFMKRIRAAPNARFVLTTRAYIFEEARRVSEHLADHRFDISKYVLDVGIYTRRIKARILYNHIVVARTPRDYVISLIKSNCISRIVDHANYNPRVVEWMTDTLHISGTSPDDYATAFLRALANPRQLWDTAFRTHIREKCKHLLYTLFFCSEYGVEIEDARAAYDSVHAALCGKYGVQRDPKDFDEALRILEGGFIVITNGRVNFINPSFRDYLSEYLDDLNLLSDFASAARQAAWARAVWRHGTRNMWSQTTEKLTTFASLFLDVAQKFRRIPIWKRSSSDPTRFSLCDLSNTDRLSLLLDWWDVGNDERFAMLATELAANPVEGFSPWLDGQAIVALICKLRTGESYENFPYMPELTASLETGLVSMLQTGMGFEILEKISDAVEKAGALIGPEVADASIDAIVDQVEDIETVVANVEAGSTLGEYADALERFRVRARLPSEVVAKSIGAVAKRIKEVEERTSIAEPPSISRQQTADTDNFDDAALQNLFGSLA